MATVVVGIFFQRPAKAEAATAAIEAAIYLKILSFDRSLKDLGDSPLTVGVLWDSQHPRSRVAAKDMVVAFAFLGETKQVTVHDRSVVAVMVDIAEVSPHGFGTLGYDAIYLGRHLGSHVSQVASAAAELGFATLCSEREYLNEGVAVGVTFEAQGTRILVNLDAARGAGMQLDPRLLSLAEIVESP